MLPTLMLSPQSVFCHSCGSRSEIFDDGDVILCPACDSTQTEVSPYLPDTYLTRRPSRTEAEETAALRGRLLRRPSLIENQEHQAAVIGLVRLYERGHIPDARFIDLLAEFSREPDGVSPLENTIAQRSTSSAGMVRYWRSDSLGLNDTPVCKALIERLVEINRPGFCTICSENIAEGENAIELNSGCGHYFHSNCIKQWFTKKNTCPTCRHEYPTDGVEFLRSIGFHEEAYDLAVQILLDRQRALKEALGVLRYVHQELATRRSSLTSWGVELDDSGVTVYDEHSEQMSDEDDDEDEEDEEDGDEDEEDGDEDDEDYDEYDERYSESHSCMSDSSGETIVYHRSRRAQSYPASPRTAQLHADRHEQAISRWGEPSEFTGSNVEEHSHVSSSDASEPVRTHRRSCSIDDRLSQHSKNIMQYTVDPLHLPRRLSDGTRRKI